MILTEVQKQIKHLYWRAGCGMPLKYLEKKNLSVKDEVEKIFKESGKFTPLMMMEEPLKRNSAFKMMSEEEQRQVKKEARKNIVDLMYRWMLNMVEEKEMLREKMTLFWLNHFSCKIAEPFLAQSFLNTVREHALGNFRDLLFAVSKHPAMLGYLNAKQNRKQHPNENFAREVMELFTLGRGNYSEDDIREAARSFTGWTVNKTFLFSFSDEFHDPGVKTFFGKTGNYKGDDILNFILEKKECAHFICTKIYKEFVNDNFDINIVSKLADYFYLSEYNIKGLMKIIFSAPWFYAKKNIGTKIKSPLELITGLMKTFNVRFPDTGKFLGYQRLLGQELFNPPNVAGWPGSKGWIDNSSLLLRLSIPFFLFQKYKLRIKAKDSFDAALKYMYADNPENDMKTDWSPFIAYFQKTGQMALKKEMANFLLQTDTEKINLDIVGDTNFEQEIIKDYAVQILGLPEYQMC